MEFSTFLRELRHVKGVSQAQTANAIQITKRHYQNYEAGKCTPSTRTILAMAEYFEIAPDILIKAIYAPTQTLR